MSNTYLKESLSELELDENLKSKLYNHQINSIQDLWCLSRKDLKKMNFSDDQINKIIIKLQLLGIDLNHKIYNKD